MFSLLVHRVKLVGYSCLGLRFLRSLIVLGGKFCPLEEKKSFDLGDFLVKDHSLRKMGCLLRVISCVYRIDLLIFMGCAVDTSV